LVSLFQDQRKDEQNYSSTFQDEEERTDVVLTFSGSKKGQAELFFNFSGQIGTNRCCPKIFGIEEKTNRTIL